MRHRREFSQRFTINLDPETLDALHALAAANDLTAGQLARRAVQVCLRNPAFLLPASISDTTQSALPLTPLRTRRAKAVPA
jgi:hypothetical protein